MHVIDTIIPQEVNYLWKYDSMKAWLDDKFEMPDNLVALLIRILEQNKGRLSKRAGIKEFKTLSNFPKLTALRFIISAGK